MGKARVETMKVGLIIVLLLGLLVAGCGNDWGKKMTIKGTDLYYTSAVTEAEAKKLGDYLVAENFANGQPKSVQLNKQGKTYEFRMVIKKGLDQDPDYIDAAKIMAADMSAKVFGGAPVDVHLCDEHLKTLRVVVPLGLTAAVPAEPTPQAPAKPVTAPSPGATSAIFQPGVYSGTMNSSQYTLTVDPKSLSTLDMALYRARAAKLFFDSKKPQDLGGGAYKFAVMTASTEPLGYITLKPNGDGTVLLSVDVQASQRGNTDSHKRDNIVLKQGGQ